MLTQNKVEILPIKISFQVTDKIKRFVYVYAVLAQKVYLIDAGVAGAMEQIREALHSAGRDVAEIDGIMLTHTHPDHIGCAAQIKKMVPECKLYVPAKEAEWIENMTCNFSNDPYRISMLWRAALCAPTR